MSNSSTSILKTGYVLNDKWVIIELIGKGAMGEVYRAHQLNLKRDVAIKIISQEMLRSLEDDPAEIKTAFKRFQREVQAMGQVRHPNVLQIFDYGSDVIIKDGKDAPVEYIVMEYIPGATLRFTMSEEGFYPEKDLIAAWLADYFLPLLEGVEAIHVRNIVHRDLKPENILLDDAIPKVADFGLACSMCMQHVTQSVDIRGTPAYMSPEHFFDFKKADRQSDIYSLGKILYEAIDGQISSKILPFKRAALSSPDTPFLQKLDQIIKDATAEEKDARFQSVGDLRNALLEALEILESKTLPSETAAAGPLSFLQQPLFIWAGIFIAVLSVALMGLWHLMGEPGKTTASRKTKQIVRTKSSQTGPSDNFQTESASPAQSVLGKDGMTMLFVTNGEIEVNAEGLNGQRQTVQLRPFYIDEKMVTNHHFAEFLNEVRAGLIVENGVVKKNGNIWFYLGKGTEPFEQIIYEHERFHLRDIKYAAYPVVRVTWYGAAAYAHHYGKRLVAENEWDYLFSKQNLRGIIVSSENTYPKPTEVPESSPGPEAHSHMMHIDTSSEGDRSSVSQPSGQQVPKNTPVYSSAVNVPDFNPIKEWAIRDDGNLKEMSKTGTQKNVVYPSLIVDKALSRKSGFKSFRYPWEAFFDVGFRCAQNFENKYEENR